MTAEHLPDWLGRRDLVRQHACLRVVSHIANGAKHFSLDDKRHGAARSTEKFRYVEEGYVEDGYFDEPLLIYLEPDEARELGGPSIDAVALAKKVIDFWQPFIPPA